MSTHPKASFGGVEFPITGLEYKETKPKSPTWATGPLAPVTFSLELKGVDSTKIRELFATSIAVVETESNADDSTV
jgi:hypothetical protein